MMNNKINLWTIIICVAIITMSCVKPEDSFTSNNNQPYQTYPADSQIVVGNYTEECFNDLLSNIEGNGPKLIGFNPPYGGTVKWLGRVPDAKKRDRNIPA